MAIRSSFSAPPLIAEGTNSQTVALASAAATSIGTTALKVSELAIERTASSRSARRRPGETATCSVTAPPITERAGPIGI